ncbi:ribulose-1,5-bisphosphate carboxylase/oxygenase large subunit [Babesia caballi]|uniref:Ribulose-1,5-bisphosphate carboxylase/oxygenase large subunit n=1 Tax=Babesia caballi TaxID=5871 RepID=A0AAV4M2A3_BABCB|nr:ribulose-1,5-bisphosphate carboxylase/oxygenase large subunit [Babesia caballi]
MSATQRNPASRPKDTSIAARRAADIINPNTPTHRLTREAEKAPEEDVPDGPVLPNLQHESQRDTATNHVSARYNEQWNLTHHGPKHVASPPETQRNRYEVLVQGGRNSEDDDFCQLPRHANVVKRLADVTHNELVNRQVPLPPVLAETRSVPPVLSRMTPTLGAPNPVELPVAKPRDFGQKVEPVVE